MHEQRFLAGPRLRNLLKWLLCAHDWLLSPCLCQSRTTIPISVPVVPGAVPIIGAPITTMSPLINLNSATSDQLDTLPGVGPSTAKAIISYRNRKGPFTKVDDLLNVPGIGPAKVGALRDQVTV